jgi:tripartite-type tricarboxylate transporter receptor subunit TctC
MERGASGNDFALNRRCGGASLAADGAGMKRREFIKRLGAPTEPSNNSARGSNMTTRRSVLTCSAAALAALSLPRGALAQTFPTKPIRIIVPFPPGGPADQAVRIPQKDMETALGQRIVIENVPGVAGQLGAQRVKQAEPDGYTLLQAASPHTTNFAVKPQASVDPLHDLAPIGQTGNSAYALCASTGLGVKTFADMVKLAKAKPGELKIGSVGIGSAHHLIAEMLKSAAGIELTHVPYRGEAPAIPDLIAGRIDLMFLTTAKPLIDDGRVIGLGVTSEGPWFNLPNVPPLTSLGLKGFVVPGWNGLMATKATPPSVIAKLSGALAAALHTQQAVRAFNAMGFKPGSGTPGPMQAQIESDLRLFTTVIRERHLKFDT